MNTITTPLDTRPHASRLSDVRGLTEQLVIGLSDADATVQSMPDASPAKWHLAHTSWFFETFVLRDFVPGYSLFNDKWPFLFNSYYETEGRRVARESRGLLTRPTLNEVMDYRQHVTNALLNAFDRLPDAATALVELGIHHEQQHQELLLTDILHLFSQNPLAPAYQQVARTDKVCQVCTPELQWTVFPQATVRVGHEGSEFAFDAERPAHDVLTPAFALANRCVTNGEWIRFIEDGGYRNPSHWLADGWAWVQKDKIEAPHYWRPDPSAGWQNFSLSGLVSLNPDAPVAHINFFEADAYASWANARLPTEAEWELAAASFDPALGNFLNASGKIAPEPAQGSSLCQMFGDLWEWTGTAFRPFPGFRIADGAVGEYNGKFMSGQFVLKGGSCATPQGHVRASYRNFFYPHQRWQFTGLRLAKDI